MNESVDLSSDRQSRSGVVWAYRFDDAGAPSLIGRDELPGIATDGPGFVWLHLDLVHGRAQDWIAAQAALPAPARAMFLSHDTHQRMEHLPEHVWGISHDLTRGIAEAGEGVGALHWIVGPHYLLTGRRQALQSISLAVEALNAGLLVASPAALFEQIVQYIIRDVGEVVAELADQIDSGEEFVLANRLGDGSRLVGSVRRHCVRVHRQLNGLHLLFRRFADTGAGGAAPETVKSCAARLLQRVDTLHHDVHSIQERARLLQDEIAGRSANQTNRQLYVLSILTALFLPATFITGLFGVNAKGVPWTDDAAGFTYVAIICLVAAWATMVVLKRRHIID